MDTTGKLIKENLYSTPSQIMSEWEARQKIKLSTHLEHVVFVGDDRGRLWAYDQTEVGNVFRMVSSLGSVNLHRGGRRIGPDCNARLEVDNEFKGQVGVAYR